MSVVLMRDEKLENARSTLKKHLNLGRKSKLPNETVDKCSDFMFN